MITETIFVPADYDAIRYALDETLGDWASELTERLAMVKPIRCQMVTGVNDAQLFAFTYGDDEEHDDEQDGCENFEAWQEVDGPSPSLLLTDARGLQARIRLVAVRGPALAVQ